MSAEQPARDWARQREDEGWDVLGCADHLFSAHRAYPHVWVTLATFAAVTSRVTLQTAFANNLFRSPVEFAQAALQMQAVSGGRFEAGLGAGWHRAEAVAAGLAYPESGERAARYAEAIEIVRQLLRTGSCSFQGAHYRVEVPLLGPRVASPPPLVAALGGPTTIRRIAPLVDRIELQLNAPAVRGGTLDMAALGAISRSFLDDLVALVRAVNPIAPLGTVVICNAGEDDVTRTWEDRLAGTFMGGFFGSAAKVAASLRDLAGAGISRVQLSPLSDTTFDLIAPHLHG